MSIVNSYDESDEIVKASIFTEGQKRLPKTAIVCFKKELIDYIESNEEYEEYSSILECGEEIKLYRTFHDGKEVLIYRTLIGGPATVLMMEELASRGVKNFIFFGSCGVLINNLERGSFIVPTEAYRDEGTSYHYLPSNEDFVKVETAKDLCNFFERKEIPFVKTKTWTTDAIYKETVRKVEERVGQGCQVVEMECASVMAASIARNLQAFYFLYSEDTLDGGKWNLQELKEDKNFILKECLKIALDVAKNI